MGYETKMYVVDNRHSQSIPSNFAKIDGGVFGCYTEDGETWYHYGKDGNTKTTFKGCKKMFKKHYVSVIGMVELCKAGPNLSNATSKPTDLYFYDLDGNNGVILDRYDEELRQISLVDMITFLEESLHEQAKNGLPSYRRFQTALAFPGCEGLYNDPQVLLFGH